MRIERMGGKRKKESGKTSNIGEKGRRDETGGRFNK